LKKVSKKISLEIKLWGLNFWNSFSKYFYFKEFLVPDLIILFPKTYKFLVVSLEIEGYVYVKM